MEAIRDKTTINEEGIACYEYCVSDYEAQSVSKVALGSFKISETPICCRLCNMEVYLVIDFKQILNFLLKLFFGEKQLQIDLLLL